MSDDDDDDDDDINSDEDTDSDDNGGPPGMLLPVLFIALNIFYAIVSLVPIRGAVLPV